MSDYLKLFRIYADYRPKEENHSYGYVQIGRSVSDAKKRFSSVVSWLKVYDCKEMTLEELRLFNIDARANAIYRLNGNGFSIWVPEYERKSK